jgi:large exoprotein involved in heme utilization and adhesion
LAIAPTGQISAETSGAGAGGTVEVIAKNIAITGDDRGFSGITADSKLNLPEAGLGGDVTVAADRITLLGGGQISAATEGPGAGGNVHVSVGQLAISGRAGRLASGIFANSNAMGAGGSGGSITLRANAISLLEGGSITAASANSGNSGSIALQSSRLSLDHGATISSANTGMGEAGSVLIRTDDVVLRKESDISTSAKIGNAGSISIDADATIKLSSGSSIMASAGANGGNISLKTGQLFYLLDSSITATAGTTLLGKNQGQNGSSAAAGAGGNITIDPTFIVLDNSLISANAAIGRGGNINLVSDFFFNSGSLITATGAQAGTVTIAAPELDLSAGLIGLSAALVDPSSRLRERCTTMLQGDFSSFVAVGRGGVMPNPGEEQVSVEVAEPAPTSDESRRAKRSKR